MRLRELLLLGCAAGLAAGCATPEPLPPPPGDLEVPRSFSAPGVAPAGDDALDAGVDPRWWRGFHDESLDDVVAQALAENQDLAIAAARIEQALAQARVAGAADGPQVEAGLSASRERQNLVGFPIPGGASFVTTAYGIALNAAWEIDLWNRLGAEAGAAQASARAAKADFAAARLSLAGQAAKGYFALIEAERQLELARRTLEIRQSTSERVRRRYEKGLAEPLDLRLALASEAAAAALVESRARQLDAARRSLEVLAGAYPRGELDAAEELPEPEGQPAAGVPSRLLARRPDLVAAELRIIAAGGRVEAARAALYPQLQLTGSLGRRAGDVEDLFDPAFTVWSLAGNLLAPLIDGGRLEAQVDLARARLSEALAAYRDTLLASFLEVETALAADRYLAAQVAASLRQLEQAEAAARLAAERYAVGLIDLLALFEAERQRLDAAAQALAARRERLQARVDLYLALGGGFELADLEERPERREKPTRRRTE